MKPSIVFAIVALFITVLPIAHAKDRIKLETTIIKGNKEMPQIVYIVPWKDMHDHTRKEQILVLHSLFGDLFEPVHENDTHRDTNSTAKTSDSVK